MDISDLLMMVIDNEASDLHLTVGLPPILRHHGKIVPMELPTLEKEDTSELVSQLLEGKPLLMEKFVKNGEVDFSYALERIGRFRVNVFKQKGNWAAALRMIPIEVPRMEEMGLPTEVLQGLANNTRGLILVTGPTGSGKSTTLATMIDYMNRTRSEHILTLEDPIEYLHQHHSCMVNQREIGFDTMTYADALRAALREDPDIILVGEMRDQETISTAITAAETGHLVLSTLHTIGAPQTIDRMIDVFPPFQQQQIRVQLADIIKGVISQQLLPRERGGRCVALEILIGTPAISNLVREGKNHLIYSQIQTGSANGMITMDASIAGLYKAGEISIETAEHYEQVKGELQRLIRR